MADDELTIDFESAGRNGDLIITARIGEQILHTDAFDPDKSSQRKRFEEVSKPLQRLNTLASELHTV